MVSKPDCWSVDLWFKPHKSLFNIVFFYCLVRWIRWIFKFKIGKTEIPGNNLSCQDSFTFWVYSHQIFKCKWTDICFKLQNTHPPPFCFSSALDQSYCPVHYWRYNLKHIKVLVPTSSSNISFILFGFFRRYVWDWCLSWYNTSIPSWSIINFWG